MPNIKPGAKAPRTLRGRLDAKVARLKRDFAWDETTKLHLWLPLAACAATIALIFASMAARETSPGVAFGVAGVPILIIVVVWAVLERRIAREKVVRTRVWAIALIVGVLMIASSSLR